MGRKDCRNTKLVIYSIESASYPGAFFVKRILYLIQCCIYRSVPKFASTRNFLGRTRRGKRLAEMH